MCDDAATIIAADPALARLAGRLRAEDYMLMPKARLSLRPRGRVHITLSWKTPQDPKPLTVTRVWRVRDLEHLAERRAKRAS